MNSGWILLIYVVIISDVGDFSKNSVRGLLDDRYDYVIIGSDHVAQSLGFHLAKRDLSKTVLVLKSDQCERILEQKMEQDPFVQSISNKFAECAHRMKYQFVNPFSAGQQVGVAYKNLSHSSERQTLLALDPNLKLLTGAHIIRFLYNPASASLLGVEVALNNLNQYIYVDEEMLIAGRCWNDYKPLSTASIISETMLFDLLVGMPLDVSVGSPILAPVLYTKNNEILRQNPTLLPTELFLNVGKAQNREIQQPNARLCMLVGKVKSNNLLWIGFVPSIYSPDDLDYKPDHEESVKILSSTLKIANEITSCDIFKQLNLTLHDQRTPECMKFVGSEQYWTCYIHNKLRRFEKKSTMSKHNNTMLSGDFFLDGVKGLRIIPFGLNTPFLNRQWNRLFPRVNYTVAQTTMSNIPELTMQNRERFSSTMDKFIETLTGLSKEAFEKRVMKHMFTEDSKLSVSGFRNLFEQQKPALFS
ncbi:uncharacterized protein LOC128738704 [Sabethes cyaneus]|uniref:uncharacterized protein LOC128738704 n=1 Tax=Sabethes cyaneus TaxID=53552 RepID=UPI00237D9EE6|nr:uncharacterized protein LOC128738704 [Sabethes cyaneus]